MRTRGNCRRKQPEQTSHPKTQRQTLNNETTARKLKRHHCHETQGPNPYPLSWFYLVWFCSNTLGVRVRMYLGHLYTVPLCTRFDRNESGSSLGVNRLIPYAEDQRVHALRTALFRLRVKQNMSLEPGFCHRGSSRGTHTMSFQQPCSGRVRLPSAPTW